MPASKITYRRCPFDARRIRSAPKKTILRRQWGFGRAPMRYS